jgi:hypothetical protein
MKTYTDIDHDSGVSAYEYGDNWIHVQFSTGAIYEYTYASAEQSNIEKMKRLADAGDGLNAFINTNVKKLYSRRIA